jgi:AcrR family transcriptional regulator
MPVKFKKQTLLNVAINLALTKGYTNVTRDEIAAKSGAAMGTVTNVLGTMAQVRRSIVRHAIRTEMLTIIAQAVIAKDKLIKKVDQDLKNRAMLNAA